VAYTLNVPRRPGRDEDGPAWVELHVVPFKGGESRAYVHGEVEVSKVRFTPDSTHLTYLAKRGEEKTALRVIPVAGGESRLLVRHEENIADYRLSPDGTRIAFLALEEESKEHENLANKGYKQEIFEEDFRPRLLWVVDTPPFVDTPVDPSAPAGAEPAAKPRPLVLDGSGFDLEWSPDGSQIAVAVAPRPLVDDSYMFKRIHVVNAQTGRTFGLIENPGKLGSFAFSPDGKHVALISAADRNDPREGRLMIAPAEGGYVSDVMPEAEMHVSGLAWQDARTVMFLADVGVETILAEVDIATGKSKTHAESGNGSPILTGLSLSSDGKRAALVGQTPAHPGELFVMAHGKPAPERRSDSNPWLADVKLASQEVVRFAARDGLELEGILLRPLERSRVPPPLLLMVHGGPESHDSNGWVTRYSRPGQLAAAAGYSVFYPNYRGSTGRGVAFSKLGQGDAAGKEFDDLVDAVDHLVAMGVADEQRVGITGGSYGGYATAWCATRYTERFRAGVMFVGISNKISKGLTTEIPLEDEMVHTLFDPWTRWQYALERSPLFHAEKSRTALLIAHGQDDTRVHPAQSLQLYRALKLIGKTPVRYVRYPGEGHGNRKAAARDDYARRLMRWMDHFVKQRKYDLPPYELEYDLGDDEGDEAAGD